MVDLVCDVYVCLGCVLLLGIGCYDVELGEASEKCGSVAQCAEVSLERFV